MAKGQRKTIQQVSEPAPGEKVLWKPVRCAKHYWEGEQCECPPGPQYRTMLAQENEILLGGARGPGKTEAGRGWIMCGNPYEPQDTPVNVSYLNHPRYRVLVLRKNQTDLQDWIDRARSLYGPLGAVVTDRPPVIEFPSGAKIILGHLKDEDAFEKYMGQEFHRIIIEELTQIPSELLYLRILASNRSTFSCEKGCKAGECRCGKLRPQVLLTCNPGGPGGAWVKSRFVKIKNMQGKLADPQPGPNVPYTDESGRTRVFIPARVTDNPFLMRDRSYIATLEALPEAQKRAWLYGDWDALSGQYFTSWRPIGPFAGEPPEARHVIREGERVLQPWWPRTIGLDWGYKHAAVALWACQCPNGQLVIYREKVFQGADPDYIGAEIAKISAPELYQMGRPINLWVSPEAVGNHKDERTVAFQIQQGINSILGPSGAKIFRPEDLGLVGGDLMEDQQVVERWQRGAAIVIRRARNQRVDGWQWMHSLMRFKPLAQANLDEFDPQYAQELLLKHGTKLYFSYVDSFKSKPTEALPRLLVTDNCVGLIDAIPVLVHEEGTEDVLKTELVSDDIADSARYLLFGIKFEQERLPLKQYVDAKMEEAQRSNPNILQEPGRFWVEDVAKREWEKTQNNQPFSLGRASRRRWVGVN